MTLGAVVPTYNRRENLRLLIRSLELQTEGDFALVVADDGSTDGTREMVDRLARTPCWRDRLRWVGCGPNQGVRTGRARNIGAANLPAGVDLLVMLDTDLLLRPDAIRDIRVTHTRHPNSALLGPVEWLPPMPTGMVRRHLGQGTLDTLRALVPRGAPQRVEGTFTGPELRTGLFDLDPDVPVRLRPEWALPMNAAWPLALYWPIGGFDERLVGYGYQDVDMGARAAANGAHCLPRRESWALHVWHPKPARAMSENQRNLDRYLRRHGPNNVVEADADWSLWWHYHADRGGMTVQSGSGLWAVDRSRRRRLRLPDETWVRRLGHRLDDIAAWPDEQLARLADSGVANLEGDHVREPTTISRTR